MQASIVYTLSVRCAEDTESQFEPEDFRDVSDFNTRQTAAALGTAVSSLSGEVFRIMNGIWLRMSTQKDGKQRRQYGTIS